MRVLGVRWVGIPTDAFDETARFARDVLGLQVSFEEAATIELETANGDALQVFGPGHEYFDFFRAHARGPVPLLEVDDVVTARCELDAAGIEVLGRPRRDSRWTWIDVRAPDGNLYELASRLK